MPQYDYHCRACGPFSRIIPMRDAGRPVRCGCRRAARRVYGTPALQTDTTFMADRQLGGGQFKYPGEYAHAKAQADRAGVSLNGRFYLSQLARFPGDPEAWVSDKGEARRLAERRGAGCPELGTKRAEVGPIERPALAPDLVDEFVERHLADVPQAARTPKLLEETRHAVIARHGKVKPDQPVKPRKREGRPRPLKGVPK